MPIVIRHIRPFSIPGYGGHEKYWENRLLAAGEYPMLLRFPSTISHYLFLSTALAVSIIDHSGTTINTISGACTVLLWIYTLSHMCKTASISNYKQYARRVIKYYGVYWRYNDQCALWNRWGKFFGKSMPLLIQFKRLDHESRLIFELEPWIYLSQQNNNRRPEDNLEVD